MKVILRVGVSVGVLAILFLVLPWSDLRGAVASFQPLTWLGVFAGFLAGHQLGVVKWRGLLRASGGRIGQADATRCYAAGLFANLCLPSIVGGDVLRAGLAAKVTGKMEGVVLAGLADRVLDVCTLATLLVVGVILAGRPNGAGSAGTVVALVALGLAAGALSALVLLRLPLRRWPRRIRRPVSRALVALRRFRKRPSALVRAFALSLVIQTSFVLLNAWIGRSVGVAAPLAVWFFVWPLAKLVGLIPISLGGLGVRDATQGALLAPWGVAMARGVVAGLFWQSVLIAGGLTGGAVWWLLGRRKLGAARAVRVRAVLPGNEHV